MKKRNVFLLGLLVVLLAMGLVLAGCGDDGSGDNGSNNSGNNSGDNDNGGNSGGNGNNSLSIRINGSSSGNSPVVTATVVSTNTTSGARPLYVQYNSGGSWVIVPWVDAGFSVQWYKNNTPISGYTGSSVTLFVPGVAYGFADSIQVQTGDIIKVTVTHTDGRTASASVPVSVL